MGDLDDLLNGNGDAADVEMVPATQSETEETQTEATPEATGEKHAEQQADDVTPASDEDGGMVPRSALLDERRKRQEYERLLDDLRQQRTAPQPQQAEEPQGPDWWGDPEGASAQLRSELSGELYQTKILMSQEMMRSVHEDYDAAEAAFIEAAQAQPFLLHEMNRHPMPARYAYEVGKRALALREIGDPTNLDGLKAKMREEIKAELMAEMGGQPDRSRSAEVPQSLAGMPGTGNRAERERWDGVPSLSELLD